MSGPVDNSLDNLYECTLTPKSIRIHFNFFLEKNQLDILFYF